MGVALTLFKPKQALLLRALIIAGFGG